ncbi:MAG TPA: amino acid deaminase, partial [Micropruina sp.]|nr:amino acid deaminase [Micropruina sp.]
MAAAIDADAVGELAHEVLDWRHKAVPASYQGWTAERFGAGELRLSDLQTPVLTLAADALEHNLGLMAQ